MALLNCNKFTALMTIYGKIFFGFSGSAIRTSLYALETAVPCSSLMCPGHRQISLLFSYLLSTATVKKTLGILLSRD